MQGYNLFAYCLNNPINMSDETGHWPKWVIGALDIISGATQLIAGVALGATIGWTGIGAVAAGFLVTNGACQVISGGAKIVNDVFDTNYSEENLVETAVKTVGKMLGGDTGQKIGSAVYTAADTVATVYSVVGGSSTALTKTAKALGKKVGIEKVTFNLFSKPSAFVNQYTVKSSHTITRSIFLPKPWLRTANGIGALTDTTRGLISIFGEDEK